MAIAMVVALAMAMILATKVVESRVIPKAIAMVAMATTIVVMAILAALAGTRATMAIATLAVLGTGVGIWFGNRNTKLFLSTANALNYDAPKGPLSGPLICWCPQGGSAHADVSHQNHGFT